MDAYTREDSISANDLKVRTDKQKFLYLRQIRLVTYSGSYVNEIPTREALPDQMVKQSGRYVTRYPTRESPPDLMVT